MVISAWAEAPNDRVFGKILARTNGDRWAQMLPYISTLAAGDAEIFKASACRNEYAYPKGFSAAASPGLCGIGFWYLGITLGYGLRFGEGGAALPLS
jgi:hypothetical protein